MSPDDIRFLYDYNAWANRRSLDAATPLTVEQFTRPLGSSFSSVRDTLAHMSGSSMRFLRYECVGKRMRRVLISSHPASRKAI